MILGRSKKPDATLYWLKVYLRRRKERCWGCQCWEAVKAKIKRRHLKKSASKEEEDKEGMNAPENEWKSMNKEEEKYENKEDKKDEEKDEGDLEVEERDEKIELWSEAEGKVRIKTW